MKTATEIKQMIQTEAEKFLSNPEETEFIYNYLCDIYTEESLLDGEEYFLEDTIESEVEEYYNNN